MGMHGPTDHTNSCMSVNCADCTVCASASHSYLQVLSSHQQDYVFSLVVLMAPQWGLAAASCCLLFVSSMMEPTGTSTADGEGADDSPAAGPHQVLDAAVPDTR
jgi:hypothetical protein